MNINNSSYQFLPSEIIKNIFDVVDSINKRIDEEGTLGKNSALSVREDLREHIRRSAKKLSPTFNKFYPESEKFPDKLLHCIRTVSEALKNDLSKLNERLTCVCIRQEDVKQINKRHLEIIKFVEELIVYDDLSFAFCVA